MYILQRNGISGNFLKRLESFLCNRKQRFVLNGQCSSWANVNAGFPQASILGPILFLIYINDLPENLQSNPDDTSLFSVIKDHNSTADTAQKMEFSIKDFDCNHSNFRYCTCFKQVVL